MSGVLKLSEYACWIPAGWVYRNVMNGISEALLNITDGGAIADELRQEIQAARDGAHYLALEPWPTEKKRPFFRAVHECHSANRKKGPVGWGDPSFFPGFLERLEELDHMVEYEARKIQ